MSYFQVKVDAKTKEKLEEYKASKLTKLQGDDNKDNKEKEENNKEEGETSDDALDEMTKQRDNAIMTSLQSLIHAHAGELSKPIEEKGMFVYHVNSAFYIVLIKW